MIYLDNNATTEPVPQVVEIVNDCLKSHWGNPNSAYSFGNREMRLIQNARKSVGKLINAESKEIFFTSCASESTTQAFLSATATNPHKKHIITTKVEHSSVLENCKAYETKGYTVTYLDVDVNGMLNLEEFRNSITVDTCLVSIMWANNETGVIFPIREIANICSEKEVLFHCDAVQAVGKITVDLLNHHIDYLSISAHKIHGPKGIGVLYVKQDSPVSPLIIGGGQESKIRGGTYNTAYIAGFGKAAELAKDALVTKYKRMRVLRDQFEGELVKAVPDVYFNGVESPRLPNTSNFGISGVDSDILMNILANKEIYVAAGSACTSDAIAPSHVITNMKSYEQANEALRISISRFTSQDELRSCINIIINILKSL